MKRILFPLAFLVLLALACSFSYRRAVCAPGRRRRRANDLPPNQTYDPDNPPQMLSESESRPLEQLILRYSQELFRLHSAP